jgi:hypothetical protein
MIFDTIKFGIFTADDFIDAQITGDFTKFTALPIDIRKKFISDVIDLHPNKESNNFKQAAFDFLDGKITEKQFRDAWREYWWDSSLAVAVAVAAVVAAVVAVEYFHPYAKHLNKVIQENE